MSEQITVEVKKAWDDDKIIGTLTIDAETSAFICKRFNDGSPIICIGGSNEGAILTSIFFEDYLEDSDPANSPLGPPKPKLPENEIVTEASTE